MPATVRAILFIAAAAFGLASSVHAGLLLEGAGHAKAATAEGVIAAVLLLALLGTWVRPAAARGLGLAALGFALLGTLVGVFTVVVGVGPQGTLELVYHALLIVGLVAGLICVRRL